MSAAIILAQAADLIDQRGWGQGSDVYNTARDNGLLCANLALGLASNLTNEAGERYSYADYKLSQVLLLNFVDIEVKFDTNNQSMSATQVIEWNDVQGRTKDEVVAALRGAAEKAAA